MCGDVFRMEEIVGLRSDIPTRLSGAVLVRGTAEHVTHRCSKRTLSLSLFLVLFLLPSHSFSSCWGEARTGDEALGRAYLTEYVHQLVLKSQLHQNIVNVLFTIPD